MPASGPVSARSRMAALTASTVVALSTSIVRSTSETGRHRHAHRVALQPAGELRDHEADRLRGAGGGRDEVQRGGARAARVLVRPVEQLLIAGVGVDRRHHAVPDAERLVEHLRDRGEAVRRAGGVGDDVVALGVVDVVEVHAERDRDVGLLGGRGDDHLARAGLEVARGVGARRGSARSTRSRPRRRARPTAARRDRARRTPGSRRRRRGSRRRAPRRSPGSGP